MKIAFFCKRFYMQKDVIGDRYGRLYALPYQLASAGHDVRCFTLSYHRAESGTWNHPVPSGSLEWNSSHVYATQLFTLIRYYSRIKGEMESWQPDFVVGASDIPHIVAVARLARTLGKPYAVDLYDNFESFGQARVPGAKSLFRRAVRRADIVSCVSSLLAERVSRQYGARGRVLTLLSTIDKSVFYPRNKIESRTLLGLPLEGQLIGTAGALDPTRGIKTLYTAFEELANSHDDLFLVLAGKPAASCPIPLHPRVRFLGSIPNDNIPIFFSALDVGVVSLSDTEFGRFSFPQKLLEMFACEIKVAVASVGAARDYLADKNPESLYGVDDADSLATVIVKLLQLNPPTRIHIKDWKEEVYSLDSALKQVP